MPHLLADRNLELCILANLELFSWSHHPTHNFDLDGEGQVTSTWSHLLLLGSTSSWELDLAEDIGLYHDLFGLNRGFNSFEIKISQHTNLLLKPEGR